MPLEPIHLIHAAIMAVSMQGALLLWRNSSLRGVCLFMLLVAAAALLNILENTGVTRDTVLLTPVFQLIWGPALYLACRRLTRQSLNPIEWLHFAPAIVALGFNGYVQVIIAIGTLSRLAYSFVTAKALMDYKTLLDAERSDSEDYQFTWLIWIVVITTLFNLVDLLRLNVQPYIATELNIIGQATNNVIWLVVIVLMTYKFNRQRTPPKTKNDTSQASENDAEDAAQFQSIFDALDKLVVSKALFRQERLTLVQLAEHLGLQTRDVSRAINLVGKKSFNEYINGLRIEYVCKLLKQASNDSLSDLAFQAGFSSKASFNRTFKQITGKTPSQFRDL